jgi:hypothetical protein
MLVTGLMAEGITRDQIRLMGREVPSSSSWAEARLVPSATHAITPRLMADEEGLSSALPTSAAVPLAKVGGKGANLAREPDASGILLTADPVSGSRAIVSIDATLRTSLRLCCELRPPWVSENH